MDNGTKYTRRRILPRLKSPALYFWTKRWEILTRLLKRLRRGREVRRHYGISTEAYENYTDWEMRVYETGSTWTWDRSKNAMREASFREVRDVSLAPILAEIRRVADGKAGPVKILEVGCGNGTNLMLIRDALGEDVALTGIDIAAKRIELGRDYWGARLDGVEMHVDSATTLQTLPTNGFDVVYTIHCLEQLPYDVDACLAAIRRVTRGSVVFVEPVWEFANPTQRLYTLAGDQLRTLLPSLGRAGFRVRSSEPLSLPANPLNQAGIVVCDLEEEGG